LQGKVYAVIRSNEAPYPPFADYHTVSLYTRRSLVKYLKFRTPAEQDKWEFEPDSRIRCKGCIHEADGKQLVFDVSEVEFL